MILAVLVHFDFDADHDLTRTINIGEGWFCGSGIGLVRKWCGSGGEPPHEQLRTAMHTLCNHRDFAQRWRRDAFDRQGSNRRADRRAGEGLGAGVIELVARRPSRAQFGGMYAYDEDRLIERARGHGEAYDNDEGKAAC